MDDAKSRMVAGEPSEGWSATGRRGERGAEEEAFSAAR